MTAGLAGDNVLTGTGGYGSTQSAAWTSWASTVGRPLQVWRLYYSSVSGSNPIPSTISGDANLAAAATAGLPVAMSFKPALATTPGGGSSTDRTKIDGFLSSCVSAGLVAHVCMYHEPCPEIGNTSTYGYTQAYYGPTVRNYYPLVVGGQCGNFTCGSLTTYQNYYNAAISAGAAFDLAMVDFYGHATWTVSNPAMTMDNLAAWTDSQGLGSFGIWEYGLDEDVVSTTVGTAWWNYMASFAAARLASGKGMGYFTHYGRQTPDGTGGYCFSQSQAAYEIPLMQAFWDAVNLTGPAPATLAVSTAQPAPVVTAGGNASVAPATLAVSTARPAVTVYPQTSPSLELSGFGSFSDIGPADTINSVTVAVAEYQSSASMGACTFELWDYSGAPAKIGATKTGTASTSTSNVSTAVFTGVTYAMLPALRVRIFAHSGTAGSGAVESADSVALTVSYSPSSGVTVTPSVLAAVAAQPAPGVSGSLAVTALAVATARPAPAVTAGGSAAVTPGTSLYTATYAATYGSDLAFAAGFPPVTVTAGSSAAVAPAVLAVSTARPAPAVSGSLTAAVLAVPAAQPAPAVSGGTATTPRSADTAKAVESAFYARSGADSGSGAEAAQVLVSGADSVHAADRAAKAWPSAQDAASAADSPLRAWPHGADTAHAAEAVKPFPVVSADTGHAAEAAHEMGIWTYVPVNVRLLAPAPYRHDPVRAARLEQAAARLSERGSWVRLTRLVRSADRVSSAGKADFREMSAASPGAG